MYIKTCDFLLQVHEDNSEVKRKIQFQNRNPKSQSVRVPIVIGKNLGFGIYFSPFTFLFLLRRRLKENRW